MMMLKEEIEHLFNVSDKCAQGRSEEAVSLPLCILRHRDLLSAISSAPIIKQKQLINTLHHIHFTNGSVLAHVTNPKYAEDFLIRCRLESCTADGIRCLWPEGVEVLSDERCLIHMILADGLSLLLFPIQLKNLDEKGFSIALPESGRLLGKRKIRRYACHDISADLIQNALLVQGQLIDFTPLAFRLHLEVPPQASFLWININETFTVCIRKGDRVIFTGSCRCVRQTGNAHGWELVLAPLEQGIQRFKKKKKRAPRLKIVPPPTAHFDHPLLRKSFCRDILNLTFSGFMVEENMEDGVLLPGMIVHDMEIRYAGILTMTCVAQVIYRREIKKGRVRCGLAILDMDFRAYRSLSHIMVHAGDPQARFSSELETNSLWEFLFETGFIYPRKYNLFQSSREEFKDTYSKLCRNDQDIEAHFTYQENGKIYGHVAIFRAYQRAWMVHHLAARPLHGKRTGLPVLKNILRFFDGLYRYPSIRMDHMIFYFRPENSFPNLFFGGFARHLGNPRACSLDLFTYLSHPARLPQTPYPEGWQLGDFESRHLPELERFYRRASGGLLLDVLRLNQNYEEQEAVEEVFQRYGFQRRWRIYSLTYKGLLKAVALVNQSSPGLNLSELLNSITIIVTDPLNLPPEALTAALARLTRQFEAEQVPLLIYPATYPLPQGMNSDKKYFLWILDTQHGREYLEYMENKTKLNLRFLLKHLLKRLMRK